MGEGLNARLHLLEDRKCIHVCAKKQSGFRASANFSHDPSSSTAFPAKASLLFQQLQNQLPVASLCGGLKDSVGNKRGAAVDAPSTLEGNSDGLKTSTENALSRRCFLKKSGERQGFCRFIGQKRKGTQSARGGRRDTSPLHPPAKRTAPQQRSQTPRTSALDGGVKCASQKRPMVGGRQPGL